MFDFIQFVCSLLQFILNINIRAFFIRILCAKSLIVYILELSRMEFALIHDIVNIFDRNR